MPETWRICQKIPGLITVMFSILEPGKHLPPHRGPYNGVLRLHLGLIIPEPRDQLGIRVENELYRWKEGEAVIFDDAFEHEAWNDTPHTRVVLFVDFIKPTRFPARFLNWLLLNLAVFTPFIREGMDNQKAWEKKFYAEAEALQEPVGQRATLCPSPCARGARAEAKPSEGSSLAALRPPLTAPIALPSRPIAISSLPAATADTDKPAPKVSFVSLGCPKALVDSERILTRLRAEGYELAREHAGADLVIVNTCGFLDSAKAESLDAIGEALEENGKVIVTGCLGAEPESISSAYPDVLAVTGPQQYESVVEAVHGRCRRRTIRSSTWCRRKASSSRRATTPT